jgi:hypothetical protein
VRAGEGADGRAVEPSGPGIATAAARDNGRLACTARRGAAARRADARIARGRGLRGRSGVVVGAADAVELVLAHRDAQPPLVRAPPLLLVHLPLRLHPRPPHPRPRHRAYRQRATGPRRRAGLHQAAVGVDGEGGAARGGGGCGVRAELLGVVVAEGPVAEHLERGGGEGSSRRRQLRGRVKSCREKEKGEKREKETE